VFRLLQYEDFVLEGFGAQTLTVEFSYFIKISTQMINNKFSKFRQNEKK
jgi:hypothetical protein